jgi:hypothetical protein
MREEGEKGGRGGREGGRERERERERDWLWNPLKQEIEPSYMYHIHAAAAMAI